MILLLKAALIYISSCVYLFRGGDQKLPTITFMRPALFAGIVLSNFIIAPYLIATHAQSGLTWCVTAYITLSFAQGYTLGVICGWHNWWNIGQSTTHFYDPYPIIDWALLLWGKQRIPTNHSDYEQVAKFPRYFETGDIRPVAWRVTREGTGFFIRMCLYTGIFLFPDLLLHYFGFASLKAALAVAALFTATFAFLSVLNYAIYSWCSAWIPQGDDKLNYAELFTGITLGSLALGNIEVMLNL